MIGTVAQRREGKKATIVANAWALAQSEGIGGVTLRALAARVGMRQPSLYEYFDSKHGLYDAMFADGNRALLERLEALELPADPACCREGLHARLHRLRARGRCPSPAPVPAADPGVRPSPESYAIAEQVLVQARELLQAAGMTDPGDIDCFVAMVGGLIAAQASNDPDGDRWIRHLDRLIDLYLDNTHEGSVR